MNKKYMVIRCYRDFNGFNKIYKQVKGIYFKKVDRTFDRSMSYREVWLTPEQYTFFLLLVGDQFHLYEHMISTDLEPTMDSEELDIEFGG